MWLLVLLARHLIQDGGAALHSIDQILDGRDSSPPASSTTPATATPTALASTTTTATPTASTSSTTPTTPEPPAVPTTSAPPAISPPPTPSEDLQMMTQAEWQEPALPAPKASAEETAVDEQVYDYEDEEADPSLEDDFPTGLEDEEIELAPKSTLFPTASAAVNPKQVITPTEATITTPTTTFVLPSPIPVFEHARVTTPAPSVSEKVFTPTAVPTTEMIRKNSPTPFPGQNHIEELLRMHEQFEKRLAREQEQAKKERRRENHRQLHLDNPLV